jgi:hypothetical protein
MNPVSRAGFTSAFATSFTEEIARRGQRAIGVAHIHNVLANKKQLTQAAEACVNQIIGSTLDNMPATKEILEKNTLNYINSKSPDEIKRLIHAITDYQSPAGDNFLMNLAVMGYRSVEHFLQRLTPDETTKIEEYSDRFDCHYAGGADTTRLERISQEASLLLEQFLRSAPAIDVLPLLKGATCEDDPVTTNLLGVPFVNSILEGKYINFNAFLSTTSSYAQAMEFSFADDVLDDIKYVVDLTKNDDDNEILRRTLKEDLEKGDCNTDSVLFYFKTHKCVGVSLSAVKTGTFKPGTYDLDSEKEILLAPGHYLKPEQVVKCGRGLIVAGSLYYGAGDRE